MGVDRCVCHEVSFARLLALHREEGLSLCEIVERTGAGTGCGLCQPYLPLTLESGVTDHPVLDQPGHDDLSRGVVPPS